MSKEKEYKIFVWTNLANGYVVLMTSEFHEKDLEEFYSSLSEEEQEAFDCIESLYQLVMDETGEEWTQEWRGNLTEEEAAAVAVFDALFNL